MMKAHPASRSELLADIQRNKKLAKEIASVFCASGKAEELFLEFVMDIGVEIHEIHESARMAMRFYPENVLG